MKKNSKPFKLIQRKIQRKDYVVSFDLHNVKEMHWTYKNQLRMRFCNRFFRATLIKSVPSKLLKIFFNKKERSMKPRVMEARTQFNNSRRQNVTEN